MTQTQYRLKPQEEAFTVMSGPMEGRTFKHGMDYKDIPEEYSAKFEPVPAPKPKAPEPTLKKTPDKEAKAVPEEQKSSAKERK